MSLTDTLLKFPSAAQIDTTNRILAAIASGNGGIAMQSCDDIKALVDLNLHQTIPVGDAFSFERETNIVASKGDSTGITGVTVDEDTFLAAVGEAHEGIYEATYDGAAWHKEDGTPIILSDFGIAVTGTAVAGDHVLITETASTLVFEVADHDKNVGEGDRSLVLLLRDIGTYGTIPFDASNLMYYTEEGLAAGTYKLTLNHGAYGGGTAQDGTYMFTLTQAIPAGGGFRHSAIGVYQSIYSKSQITGGKFTTYGALPARTTVESNIVTTEWDGVTEATDLGVFSARSVAYMTKPFTTESELDAGTYKFTLKHGTFGGNTQADKVYKFTTTQAIPAGGGFVHPAIMHLVEGAVSIAKVTGFKIKTFNSAGSVVESNITVSEYSSGAATDLGTISAMVARNFTERQAYGSNRYATSAARQWLTSKGKAVPSGDTTVSYWWSAQTPFDMVPGGAKSAGFMHGIDPSLVAVVGKATLVTELPDPERTAGMDATETLYDFVFLPSKTEIYGGTNITVSEGSQYALFVGTGNAEKIKRQGSTARYWFFRSAYPGYAGNVRVAFASGALSVNDADNAFGLVPGLIIKSGKSDRA